MKARLFTILAILVSTAAIAPTGAPIRAAALAPAPVVGDRLEGASTVKTAWVLSAISDLAMADTPVESEQLCLAGPSYSVGLSPGSVTVGDLNADSSLDLAVTNWGDGLHRSSVSILLGNGDGTFQDRMEYPTGVRPDSVAVGDFNADGKPDLAVANYGCDFCGSNVSILLGNGDGTFQAAISYPAGTNPVFAAVGDFNGDDELDLAVGDNNPPWGVSILPGNGDGTFQAPILTDWGFGNPRLGVVSDLNGDGHLDLALGSFYEGVRVLFGIGDGTFQAPVIYPAGLNVEAVTGGDFDRDGRLDLAVANSGSGNVSVLIGNGDGSFQSAVNYAAGAQPLGVVVADFDGDGMLDLGVANDISESVSMLLGNGDGTFQSATNYPVETGTLFESPIDVGDFNGDDRPDLGFAEK